MSPAALGGLRSEQAGAASAERGGARAADKGRDFAALLGAPAAERPAPRERSDASAEPVREPATPDELADAPAQPDASDEASPTRRASPGKPALSDAPDTPDGAELTPPASTVVESSITGDAPPTKLDADAAMSTDPASPPLASEPLAMQAAGDWLNTIRSSQRLAVAGDRAGDGRLAAAVTAPAMPSLAARVAADAGAAADGESSAAVPFFAATLPPSTDAASPATAMDPINLSTATPMPETTPFATAMTSANPPPATAPAATPLAPAMALPPDHPDFPEALGERIVWITDAGLSSARIEMNPQSLGSVSVHVQIRHDEAQVAFAADNPVTRAMLQQTMPQLRELFAGQGLQLLRSQVEQRSTSSREQGSSAGFGASRSRTDATTATHRVSRLQLVDAYV